MMAARQLQSQKLFLKWSNFQPNLTEVFQNMLSSESLVDVTLACEGASIKAHKMVLAAGSPYFQSLFVANPCKHPIVILKDVRFTDLKLIIDFMYKGEVNVEKDQLNTLIKTAETLKVKGLSEATEKIIKANQNASQTQSTMHLLTQDLNLNLNRTKKRKKNKRRNSQSNCDDSEVEGVSFAKQKNDSDIGASNSGASFNSNSHNQYLLNEFKTENQSNHSEDIEPAKLLEQSMSTPDADDFDNSIDARFSLTSHGLNDNDDDDDDDNFEDITDDFSNSEHPTNDPTNSSLALAGAPGTSLSNQIYEAHHTYQGTNSVDWNKKCPYCLKEFTKTYSTKRHILSHLNAKMYKCDLCNKSYTRKDVLIKHQEKHQERQQSTSKDK